MSVIRLHGLYAIQAGATVLHGITQERVTPGTEVRGEATSGQVYPQFQSITGQKPRAGFSTHAIAAALNLTGVLGLSIADLSGGLSAFAQLWADGATRAGAASHRKYNIRKGLLLPQTLTVDHQGDATLSYEALVVYDGANDPIVITDSVSLPAVGNDDQRFGLGPFTVENVALGQLRNLSINFGIRASSEGADGDIWDTWSSIQTIEPTITLRGTDVQWLKAANIPLLGKSATHALTSFYLRKKAAGATFVANGTAQHIRFTAAGLAHIETAFDASGAGRGEIALTMPLRFDGTNAPLLVNTASAI